MQELQNLHRNYSSGAIIEGYVHPTTENIFLLKNIDMYNYTAVSWVGILTQFWCLLIYAGSEELSS